MSDHPSLALAQAKQRFVPSLGVRGRRSVAYLLVLLLPFALTQTLDMDARGGYVAVLGLLNTLAMMAFFVQFPLAGRIRSLPFLANIDWNMEKHKSVGKWLGAFLLLHPVMVLAPRFGVSVSDGVASVVDTLSAPQMLTGVLAWVLMAAWVLVSIYKNRLRIGYETWRLTHILGFVGVAVLATVHITSVGRYSQFDPVVNGMWWALCALSIASVTYNVLVKPVSLDRRPGRLIGVEKASDSDWQLRMEAPAGFSFEPGQFVWLSSGKSAFGPDQHPFSIASCTSELPEMRFLVRALGDYTSRLDTLTPGQPVFVDGPYGSLSLGDTAHCDGIVLVAGGAGIGPMLSLLLALARRKDPRPVRLIYGNGRIEQMAQQAEIADIEARMPDFRQHLVCLRSTGRPDVHEGVIDRRCVEGVLKGAGVRRWGAYLCGPEAMIESVRSSLVQTGVDAADIHYEQLAF